MSGVVAAGHPLTAEAGAAVLREGGNAVDAAVAAVLMSFVAEPPLTGPAAGGFMLVHTAGGESALLDFFVGAPGEGGAATPGPLEPIEVHFASDAVQVFYVGCSSCGVYGTPAGLEAALERWGTLGLGDLVAEPARAARDGVEIGPRQAYLHEILAPIYASTPEGRAVFEPDGRPLREGERWRHSDLGDLLERLGSEGPAFLYTGDVARAVCDWVGKRGGLITEADLAAYEPIAREPAEVAYRGRRILTNPPPAPGGPLIAYALGCLERVDREPTPAETVAAMALANEARTEDFFESLHRDGFLETFLRKSAAERLGSTTHISVMDDDGACASVTCSNGSGSGVVVPGTGLHMNNMLGEEDLNPHGWHRHRPGRRVPSMMAPTVVLRDGRPELALGSAGSNRIRSAILQTIVGFVDAGLGVEEAVERPRLHLEAATVEAEPGFAEDGLAEIEAAGRRVHRWRERNLFFGGVQAVAREPGSGALSGAADSRRGGAVVHA
ncbi:MAG TPA: gamma-glutamyltransferase [Thermoleophilaceae bacterium]|nr:gamma-glutamyltransferase [Thermoleophilaceae bacterium]